MKNKTLNPIRISESTFNNIKSAIREYNKNNLVNLSEAEFRRISYELLSQLILQKKEIPLELL